jgi:hypothetical protein
VGPQPLACLDYGFESRQAHGYPFLSESCVLSGTCFCDGPISRPEDVLPGVVCLSVTEEEPHRGGLSLLRLSSYEGKKLILINLI